MKEAAEQLALDFRQATALNHKGERGSRREDSVRRFLQERLPGAYKVDTGIAFDAHDTQSKQLDVLIYRAADTPFLLPGDPAFVPCESLLAAVEIKSTLKVDTIKEALEVGQSLRSLRPFDRTFIDPRQRGEPADDNRPRCLFTIFAFETDLVEGDDWLIRESARLARIAGELNIPLRYVDRLIVMDRGVINLPSARGHDSSRNGLPSIQIWFVHLMNHLVREDRRRPPIDMDLYASPGRWMPLPELVEAAADSDTQVDTQPSAKNTRRPRTRTRKGKIVSRVKRDRTAGRDSRSIEKPFHRGNRKGPSDSRRKFGKDIS